MATPPPLLMEEINMLVEQLMNGLGQGMIYALMSLGYALIYGVVGLVTFAHGDVIMLGAFAAYYTFSLVSGNLLVALLAGFLVSGLMGFVVHRVCYNRFFSAPRQISLICTIGMGMFLRNLVQVMAGTETKPIPDLFGSEAIAFARTPDHLYAVLHLCGRSDSGRTVDPVSEPNQGGAFPACRLYGQNRLCHGGH